MNWFEKKTIELSGGPSDGERLEVYAHVHKVEKLHLGHGLMVWEETVHATADGFAIFEYAGYKDR